jgi:hypothetical protein
VFGSNLPQKGAPIYNAFISHVDEIGVRRDGYTQAYDYIKLTPQ